MLSLSWHILCIKTQAHTKKKIWDYFPNTCFTINLPLLKVWNISGCQRTRPTAIHMYNVETCDFQDAIASVHAFNRINNELFHFSNVITTNLLCSLIIDHVTCQNDTVSIGRWNVFHGYRLVYPMFTHAHRISKSYHTNFCYSLSVRPEHHFNIIYPVL